MPAQQPATPTLVAIRAAHHADTKPEYDRVVFEFSGPVPYLRIEYVTQLIADGSGAPVHIAGKAILSVQFTPARAHTDRGKVTAPNNLNLKLPLAKQIVSAGDFEDVVTYGIGLARKADTRILTLGNPLRIVIDFLV
jgi:hypothetical protein